MSQHRRNYRPRKNDNQIKQEVELNSEISKKQLGETTELKSKVEIENTIIEEDKKDTKLVEEEIKNDEENIDTKLVEQNTKVIKGELTKETKNNQKEIVDNKDKEKENVNIKNEQQVNKKKIKQVTKEKETKQESIESKLENKKPHYVFDRDSKTGLVKRITGTIIKDNEVGKMETNNEKLSILNSYIIDNERAIVKLELEIDIHERMRDKETDLNKIEVLERKIKRHRETLEELIGRKEALKEMLEEYKK